jgi:hypothetical protein
MKCGTVQSLFAGACMMLHVCCAVPAYPQDPTPAPAAQEVQGAGEKKALDWHTKPDAPVGESGVKVVQALGMCLAALFMGLFVYRKYTGAPSVRGGLTLRVILCAVGPDRVSFAPEPHGESRGFGESLDQVMGDGTKYEV